MYQTLISTENAKNLDNDVIFIDCRHQLGNPAWGKQQYALGHLPQARFAHIDHDLSSPVITGLTGRHPLPDPVKLIAFLGTLGITPDTQVVVYDQDNGMFAARLWWLLRAMGHKAVALLDGGYAAWVASGGLIEQSMAESIIVNFKGDWHPLMVDSHNIFAKLDQSGRVLIDARLPAHYQGLEEPIDRKAGHIPGAINLPFNENLDNGYWRSKESLKARFETFSDQEVVCYCGSGITACHNILAMVHAGLPQPLLYAGSWSEWIVDDERPVNNFI